MRVNTFARLLGAALLLFGVTLAHAQATSTDLGDYVVHYNALNTDILDAKIAKSYGIKRSKHRGMMNVSILRKEAGTFGIPVTATVSAFASNLNNQVTELQLREIREKEAIYYISEFGVDQAETLNFTISVTPEDKGEPQEIKFSQRFFVD